jgi:hypothetical protein
MPSWDELLNELDSQPTDQKKAEWLIARQRAAISDVAQLRGDRNTIFYASAFLQKSHAPPQLLQLTHEEINGFMSVVHGLDCSRGLTLLLHTPGGVTNAAETIVAYLHSKFTDIEVIVPTYSMSAGTMISLAAGRIIMGRQSQLGPIDPQMPVGGRFVSARAVVDQFERAKGEVLAQREAAHVWAPVLQSLGPSLLQEAQNALDYGERMVAQWLEERMFKGQKKRKALAKKTAKHFNDATTHKSHGRRIDRDEARSHGVIVEDLEANQKLQEAVLTLYHLVTIAFEKSPATKVLLNQNGNMWLKNFQ